MLTVEEAQAQILARMQPRESERVELLAALGRVLAETVVSTREIPPWANSSMDGYAIRSDDTDAGAATLRVVGRVAAGTMPDRRVGRGEAVRIFTGAPMPGGADAVVPQEDVEADEARIVLRRPVKPGDYVRSAGEDVRPGDIVLERGQRVGAAEIGLLATLGRPRVEVYRRPRVAILSTGNEIADLGTEPGPGAIPNTNTYSLMAQVLETGAEPMNLGVARDRVEAVEERLRWGARADVVISSAGVSVGEHDVVKEAFTRVGAELLLWRVSMRPGKPITFGSWQGRSVFGLPGNPVSAMVTFELFVRPALLRLAGHRELDRPRVRARAETRIVNAGRRRGYLRVTLRPDGHEYRARLTGEQGSAILRSMVLADGLAVLEGDTTVEEGEYIEVIRIK